jgi:hypothetical protein
MALSAYGVTLTQGQKESLAKAARDGTSVALRLTVEQLQGGGDKLGLKRRQITHLEKKKSSGTGTELAFSKTQMKQMTKKGGILPLPLILGGVGAAGSLAGASAGIAKAVEDAKANKRAQAEAERHNREVEVSLRGSGLYLGRETHGSCCPMCKGSGVYLSKN